MKLSALLEGISYFWMQQSGDPDCTQICFDSRKVQPGALFVCIKGEFSDGHRYVEEAIRAGACAIVCDGVFSLAQVPSRVAVVRVAKARQALAVLAANFYHHADRRLKLIGVTGTNGKSTSVTFLQSILQQAGKKTGLIGTIENDTGKRRFPSGMTTPEATDLQQLFAEMVDAGCEYCVMEVSSHALAQDRVYGLTFEVGIFTNLTHDHLKFHHTFEQYYQAKYQLMRQSKHCVVQVDDLYGRRMVNELREEGASLTTVALDHPAHFQGSGVVMEQTGSSFFCNGEAYSIRMPGRFNVSNALGCIAAARLLNIPAPVIRAGIADVQVAGRMERVFSGQFPFEIFIDFAHTPDGLQKALETVRLFTEGRVIAVYGSGGDPDPEKRVEMGRIGTALADIAVFTSDNPKNENPMQILYQMASGAETKNYHLIPDRAEAIAWAIANARPGDTVLLAGKGHETYQWTKEGREPFSEREQIASCLRPNRVFPWFFHKKKLYN